MSADASHNAPSGSQSDGTQDHTNSNGDDRKVDRGEDADTAKKPDSPAPSQQAARPSLPRLTSKSRAPNYEEPDSKPAADSSKERTSSQPARSPTPEFTVPVKLRETREIGLDKYRVRDDEPSPGTSRRNRSDSQSSHGSEDSQVSDGTESLGRESPSVTPRASPSLKAKDDSEPSNPTIQIPKVTPLASGLTLPPNLAELAEGLEDKYVDEFGNILEWDGRVLGSVAGDLPQMVGRPVSATGEVMNAEGEVVGYVAENDTISPPPPPPQPIQGMGNGLQVDHLGNILDSNNNVVGHFNGDHLNKGTQKSAQSGDDKAQGRTAQAPSSAQRKSQNCSCHPPKPTAAPSPSEIYLDVKSTNDGVQLIIKIPTVFNGGGGPNIHISSG